MCASIYLLNKISVQNLNYFEKKKRKKNERRNITEVNDKNLFCFAFENDLLNEINPKR